MESNDVVEFRTQREETLSKMRAQLPEYVVNCLVASGFDSNMALGTLDLSDKPDNSLEKINQYVSKIYPDVYDSSYFDCNEDTLIVIAQLVRSNKMNSKLNP